MDAGTTLVFKRATLYSNMTEGSGKLKVRILPDNLGNAPEDLPIYPMFNKSMVIHGAAEEDTGDPNKSTLLWVLCTPDKLNGFIFQEANVDSDLYEEKEGTDWPYTECRNHIKRMNLNVHCFNYKELKVLYSTQPFFNQFTLANVTEKNGVATAMSLDIINIRTGERWFILSSGTCISIQQGKIVCRVGSPNSMFSTITQTPKSITLKADDITLDAQHLCLGHHGYHLPGIQGFLPTSTTDGMSIIPIPDITV